MAVVPDRIHHLSNSRGGFARRCLAKFAGPNGDRRPRSGTSVFFDRRRKIGELLWPASILPCVRQAAREGAWDYGAYPVSPAAADQPAGAAPLASVGGSILGEVGLEGKRDRAARDRL